MMPHHQINIIHHANTDKFTFAAEITNFSFFCQFFLELQIHTLFCRNRHKNRRTVQTGFYLRIRQGNRRAQYAGQLGMVSRSSEPPLSPGLV